MNIDQTVFNQIATTLAGHFDSVFYVDIETGEYTEFVSTQLFKDINFPKEGEDFFAMSKDNASGFVHPNDIDLVLRIHDRETIRDYLNKNGSYSISCRLHVNGKTMHIRHIEMMCEDKRHVLFCMENIDDEVREKEEQLQHLKSVEMMAKIDRLTGIRNNNAFVERMQSIDNRIHSADSDLSFGIVMCDVNDLKRVNDMRGHRFGDEMLQRACRMICDVYRNSQVYRTGGDEFVVVLMGEDYDIREELLENLRRESMANNRLRSGPVIACGMAVFDPSIDAKLIDVEKRADAEMYGNKAMLKSDGPAANLNNATKLEIPIPEERRRKLDSLFDALFTMAGDGYVYLNDLKYDYSRWSFSLVHDFGMESEYMYHAGRIWQDHIHPDDVESYKQVVEAVVSGNAEPESLIYHARRQDDKFVEIKTRAFVLNDTDGNPEYFGGIMIPQ
ncbi:MAG: diguanylate cyclase [Lachnospiraceae bacterium]|nr:diguanylate cyclase [Lachnospiraceae bacterium]